MVAHTKRADELVPGDWINVNGSGGQVVRVEVEKEEGSGLGIVWVDFDGYQDAFAADYLVEYVTAEEWERG